MLVQSITSVYQQARGEAVTSHFALRPDWKGTRAARDQKNSCGMPI
jgi:hypothetical protein